MSELLITYHLQDSFIIRMNRPRERNRLSEQMIAALSSKLLLADSDERVSRIIITGSEDVFSSGADINLIRIMMEKGSASDFAHLGRSLIQTVSSSSKETVAAINGLCYGGGLDLSLACDRRIATPNATFCHPGVNRGFITPWGGTQRLSRLVGEAAAMEMFLTGEPIDAENALRIGLIDKITDDLTFVPAS